MRIFVYSIFAIWLGAACICSAAPKPAIIPASMDWTVDVTFEHPQQIMVIPAGSKEPKRFWYTIMTIANKTNRDVNFYPKCELMTDTFEVIPAGKDTSVAVFDQIKRRHRNKYPLLEYWEQLDSRILQGQDNARDVAIVWPDFDANAKNIKIFIAGLSSETVAVKHPTEKDENGEPVKVFLRKTLELSYDLAGDAALRSDVKVTYEGKRWVMR